MTIRIKIKIINTAVMGMAEGESIKDG